MGRFDLDSLLSDLGLPQDGAETNADAAPAANHGNARPPTESDDQAATEHNGGGRSHAREASTTVTISEPSDSSTDEVESLTGAQGAEVESERDHSSPAPLLSSNTTSADILEPGPDDALQALWRPSRDQAPAGASKSDLGLELQRRGVIAADVLENARTVQRQSPGRTLKEILVERGVAEEVIQRVIAEQHGLEFERVEDETSYNHKLFDALGADYCKKHGTLPLRREGSRAVIGTTQPDDVFLLDDVRRKTGIQHIKHVLITAEDIHRIVEAHQQEGEHQDDLTDILASLDNEDLDLQQAKTPEDEHSGDDTDHAPIIRLVNVIIQRAITDGASDIHIEPAEKKLKIRFRIDGVLFEVMNPPLSNHAAIISRLKIMANLDIAERRVPQDGRIRAVLSGRKLDLRVSTLPTVSGEKCVIRILDNRSISVGLDQLGFEEDTLQLWRRQIGQPHGIILVTGPTGSGKTTTLYSSLREMDTQRLNVSTTEDPVEYHLDNVSQIQINEKIGLSFAAALRSLLRQDPDVVMVGEIRDTDTARIAIQAALTGHLVLSTLHTNDAPSSVTRLINIGVEPFLIGGALNAVLAQRLVRRICPHCKAQQEPSEEIAEFLTMQGLATTDLYSGSGCDRCRQIGYSGRVGIYELLVLDDVTRDAIARSPNVTEFRRMCIERGMVPLRQDGMRKVAKGLTTVEEVLRVCEATI
ncbi:MAG: GspE/PulE family protein [Phycisphaerales bacterium]